MRKRYLLIRLRFDGAKKLAVDRAGNLVILARNGSISFHNL
jgi:hypothetical protein